MFRGLVCAHAIHSKYVISVIRIDINLYPKWSDERIQNNVNDEKSNTIKNYM